MKNFLRAMSVLLIFCFVSTAHARGNKVFTELGDWGQAIIPISALIAAYNKEKNYEGIKQLAKTYASTMAITYALKYSINAKRPNGGRHSFPSGHASSAFAGASFLAFRYGPKYGVPAYLAAAVVAASRIDNKAHSLADVTASATISLFCGNFFTKRYRENLKIDASPIAGGGGQLNLELTL